MRHHGTVNPSDREPLRTGDRDLDPAVNPPPVPAALPGPLRADASAGRPDRVARQNRAAFLLTLVMIVALAFGGGIAVGRATAPSGASGIAPAPAGSTAASQAAAGSAGASAASTLPSDGALLGRSDARVTITYWADFQCPFCARFASDVLPQLDSRIADGTVAVQHRDFAFIGSESIDAAVAVRCGGEQGKYWPMHDAVYAAQSGENQGGFAQPRLQQISGAAGLDAAAFSTCVARHDILVGVLADTAAGVRSGVTSTPTIDVNGKRFLGVTDVPAFLAAIDAAAGSIASGAAPVVMPTSSPSGDPWAGSATSGREAGAPTAPVTVELWMDYQAQASATIANTLEPDLRTRIAAGKIRVVQRDLALLGDESATAAVAVRCTAKQGGSAWFVHDVLSVSAQGDGQGIFVNRNLLRLGARLGLDIPAFDTCLADPSVAAAVTTETGAGTALGLKAGPAVIVRVGDREVARFTGTLDMKKVLAAIDAAK